MVINITAILALRKKIKNKTYTVYAADSLIIADDKKILLKNSHKYVEFPNFVVLFAGDVMIQSILEDLLHRRSLKNRVFMKMQNRSHVQKFAKVVENELLEKGPQLDEKTGEPILDYGLLIITKDKLYAIEEDGFPMEKDDFVAGGIGEQSITPILHQRLGSIKSKEGLYQLAEDAINVAIDMNTSCGPPIVVKFWELRK